MRGVPLPGLVELNFGIGIKSEIIWHGNDLGRWEEVKKINFSRIIWYSDIF